MEPVTVAPAPTAASPAWLAAQVGERRFHCDEVEGFPSLAERRAREREMRAWYAGMLRIPLAIIGAGLLDNRKLTVTDFGCGPESLLLSAGWDVRGSLAVDPLVFLPADEIRYEAAYVRRQQIAAEEYVGPRTDEVWAYNVLQHVRSVEETVASYLAHARETIRIFEWVGVPTDRLHLHTVGEGDLCFQLQRGGFAPVYQVNGLAEHSGFWRQKFYAGVWRRA